MAVRDGETGQLRGEFGEVDHTTTAEVKGVGQHAGVTGQAPGHLRGRTQMCGGRRGQIPGGLVEGLAAAQRGQRLRQPGLYGCGVVHGVGGDDRQAEAAGGRMQGVVAQRVGGQPMVDQLDVQLVGADQFVELLQVPYGRTDIAHLGSRLTAGGLPGRGAAGQHGPAPAPCCRTELWQVVDGCAFGACQLGRAEGGGELPETGQVAGEHHESAVRGGQAQLRPVDGAEVVFTGFGGQAPRGVETVPVGDSQHLDAQLGCLRGQNVGIGRALKERERRVDVQLRPADRSSGTGGLTLGQAQEAPRSGSSHSRLPPTTAPAPTPVARQARWR